MSRKYEAIDIMDLYINGDSNKWNQWLYKCLTTSNLDELMKVRYSVQAGMDDLVKAKMNTEKLQMFFIRLNVSIEKTAKKIIKKKIPNPHDDPNDKANYSLKLYQAKKQRDHELELFMRKSAY